MSVKDQLFLQNLHWQQEYTVPTFHRDLFQSLLENLNHKQVITLVGPRRVGKTTMLQQMINYLIREKKVMPENILYFSLDLYKKSLLSLYNSYTGELSREYRGIHYLIFDEIQYLEEWGSHVKLLYDHLPNSKIIISGSSAADLRRGKETLAGREIELFLPPLSFKEYLTMKRLNISIDALLWREYMTYMNHQLPEMLNSISEREYIRQLVDKVINSDFVRIHKIRDTTAVDTIFRMICKSPGDVIINSDLARDMQLDARTVQNYLNFLEQALLIRKVYNYSKNPRKSETRHKRYYPYYTSLHWYIYPYPIDFGKKAETEVAFQISPDYFLNNRGSEIDFIVGNDLDVAVEVKMRNIIKMKHIRTLVNSNFNHKYVVVKIDSKVDVDGIEILSLHHIKNILKKS